MGVAYYLNHPPAESSYEPKKFEILDPDAYTWLQNNAAKVSDISFGGN
jgi:hypothetical protein